MAETDVIVGTALASGEDGVIDALFEVLVLRAVLAEEDETGTGATEGLVSEDNNECHYH